MSNIRKAYCTNGTPVWIEKRKRPYQGRSYILSTTKLNSFLGVPSPSLMHQYTEEEAKKAYEDRVLMKSL